MIVWCQKVQAVAITNENLQARAFFKIHNCSGGCRTKESEIRVRQFFQQNRSWGTSMKVQVQNIFPLGKINLTCALCHLTYALFSAIIKGGITNNFLFVTATPPIVKYPFQIYLRFQYVQCDTILYCSFQLSLKKKQASKLINKNNIT